jgi:hypothetical protein
MRRATVPISPWVGACVFAVGGEFARAGGGEPFSKKGGDARDEALEKKLLAFDVPAGAEVRRAGLRAFVEDILAHLRSPGPHVRGCWAVDSLLGKG